MSPRKTAKQRAAEIGEELVDVGRAAELLGYSYNAILYAINAGVLKTSGTFERKGGGKSPLIKKKVVEAYRQNMIARYATMPKFKSRLADLKKRKVLTK